MRDSVKFQKNQIKNQGKTTTKMVGSNGIVARAKASNKACGMLKRSHKFLDEKGRWASLCKGAKRSVHNQGMADRLLCSLYEREEPKISHFKIKNTPKASVKYSIPF